MSSTQADTPAAGIPLVGLGASAGALHPLRTLLTTLPAHPGAAFIVSADALAGEHADLAAVLRGHSPMPVTAVHGHVALAPDHVYLIPPDRRLALTDTTVSALPCGGTAEQQAPVDRLLCALAAHRGNAIAMLLSGGGASGDVGVKALKAAGGVILVQDPAEAVLTGMPRPALAGGAADLVLPVHELAGRLVALLRHRHDMAGRFAAPERLAPDEQAVLVQIIGRLNARTGHDFSGYKRDLILRRVTRRMQVHGLGTLAQYLALLRDEAAEPQALLQDLLLAVGGFFRDAPAWAALARQVLPRLFDDRPAGAPLRVWVPGCGGGEEAYSLAMLLVEEAERRADAREIQIFASDPDERAVAAARQGRYGLAIAADVSAERLARFFVREDARYGDARYGDARCAAAHSEAMHYRVRRELRSRVLCAHHSLLRDPPFARQDLICCRNLLSDLEPVLQEQVSGLLRYALCPGGYLFLGAGEQAVERDFSAVDAEQRIYRAREGTGRPPPRPELPAAPHRPARTAPRPALQTAPQTAPQWRGPTPQPAPQPAAHLALLEALAPPSVLVDARRHAVHILAIRGALPGAAAGAAGAGYHAQRAPRAPGRAQRGARCGLRAGRAHAVGLRARGAGRGAAVRGGAGRAATRGTPGRGAPGRARRRRAPGAGAVPGGRRGAPTDGDAGCG
jgi:two-component system, chemotaxis family, CheB/CheR fusion protein